MFNTVVKTVGVILLRTFFVRRFKLYYRKRGATAIIGIWKWALNDAG
jgi:hypothetical protein